MGMTIIRLQYYIHQTLHFTSKTGLGPGLEGRNIINSALFSILEYYSMLCSLKRFLQLRIQSITSNIKVSVPCGLTFACPFSNIGPPMQNKDTYSFHRGASKVGGANSYAISRCLCQLFFFFSQCLVSLTLSADDRPHIFTSTLQQTYVLLGRQLCWYDSAVFVFLDLQDK